MTNLNQLVELLGNCQSPAGDHLKEDMELSFLTRRITETGTSIALFAPHYLVMKVSYLAYSRWRNLLWKGKINIVTMAQQLCSFREFN